MPGLGLGEGPNIWFKVHLHWAPLALKHTTDNDVQLEGQNNDSSDWSDGFAYIISTSFRQVSSNLIYTRYRGGCFPMNFNGHLPTWNNLDNSSLIFNNNKGEFKLVFLSTMKLLSQGSLMTTSSKLPVT